MVKFVVFVDLGDYAERYLVDAFSSVPNVGRILVGGLRELSVRVWIYTIKLAENNLTIQEVERALRNENINLPAGTLEANNKDLSIFNVKSLLRDGIASSLNQDPVHPPDAFRPSCP